MFSVLGAVVSLFFTILTPQPEVVQISIIEPHSIIALTFDDGPSLYTEKILNVLEEHNALATFFVLGSQVQKNPCITARAAALGHQTENHSFDHEDFRNLSEQNIRSTITKTSDEVEAATGTGTTLVRPPYGVYNEKVKLVLQNMGYPIVLWSVDTRDWESRDTQTIYDHIMDNAVNGAIILLHDVRLSTYEAVALAVPELIARGYRFVTVNEVLEYVYGNLQPGRVYRGNRK